MAEVQIETQSPALTARSQASDNGLSTQRVEDPEIKVRAEEGKTLKPQAASSPLQAQSLLTECTICFAEFPDAILGECGHGGICYECAVKMMREGQLCPYCRGKIVAVYKSESPAQQKSVIEVSREAVCVDEAGNRLELQAQRGTVQATLV